MIKHQGGCHCGKFSIKVELDPLIVTLCHCVKCRRLTGAVVSNCFYEMSEVQFEGDTLLYDYIGGSGKTVHTHVCSNCYTIVYRTSDAFTEPEFVAIPVGCFDNPHILPPTIEIFRDYKLKWLQDDGSIKVRVGDAGYLERIGEMIKQLDHR